MTEDQDLKALVLRLADQIERPRPDLHAEHDRRITRLEVNLDRVMEGLTKIEAILERLTTLEKTYARDSGARESVANAQRAHTQEKKDLLDRILRAPATVASIVGLVYLIANPPI